MQNAVNDIIDIFTSEDKNMSQVIFYSKTLRHLYDKSDILRMLRKVVRFESGSRATSCLSRVFKRSTKYIFVTVYVINYILYIIVSCTMRCNHILS